MRNRKLMLGLVLAFMVLAMLACGETATPTKEAAVAPTQPPVEEATEPPEPKATDTPTVPTPTPIPPTPTAAPPGLAYGNPVPLGQGVVADNDIEVMALGVTRDAWPKVQQANMFNDPPEEGHQYVLIQARASNLGSPDETKKVEKFHFRVTGSRGVIYEPAWVVIDNPLEGEFFGGGVLDGELCFEIALDETNLVLIYDPGLESSARWLALEEIAFPIVAPIEPAQGAEDRGREKGEPAGFGTAILSDEGLEITVLGTERNAWQQIYAMNEFNDKPAAGMEYILVEVQVRYIGGREQTATVDPLAFRVVGEKGVIYERPWLVIDNELRAELFQGGTFIGLLGLEVTQDEGGLILIYDPGLGSTARYLSLD